MKNFLMRGVVLVTLLSFLVLPASAAFSSTDSTNITNIKTYTFDIKNALTSGALYKNVSSIETSVKNISSSVSSIYTQIQASNNHLSTGNANTSSIKDRIGSITNTGYRSIAEAMLTLGVKLDSSVTKLTETSNKITTFDNNVWGKLTTIADNTASGSGGSGVPDSLLNNVSTITSNSNNIKTNVKSIKDSIPVDGFSTEVKQDTVISKLGVLDSRLVTPAGLSVVSLSNEILSAVNGLTSFSPYQFLLGGDVFQYTADYGALSTLSASMIYDEFSSDRFDSNGNNITYRGKTILGNLKNLSDTLASDEDKAIRESQNDNVGQIKNDFISGSSGGTSLGKSDFGDLSTAGSTAKDLTSLNGQASVGKFSEGLTDANTSGLGWFSADTKNALDTVPAFSGKRAPARDSDPYNMSGFSDNYNWLFGGD